MDFDSLLLEATDSLLIKPDLGVFKKLGQVYAGTSNA